MRFEQSQGLDTALYKNVPLNFITAMNTMNTMNTMTVSQDKHLPCLTNILTLCLDQLMYVVDRYKIL